MHRILRFAGALAAVGLAGCITIGDSSVPIGSMAVAAPEAAAERTLVIVLPGIGSDALDLQDHGIAAAIHAAWPGADVILTSATIAYYRDGRLVNRLHEEFIEPARARGYRNLWLAGASLGGMGALLYEREYPGALTGLVLFSPFLGDIGLGDEIRDAGGVRSWSPGPLPDEVNSDNYQRQVWRMVKGWAEHPDLVHRVWLAYGTSDYMVDRMRLLAPEIPAEHRLELPGGHTWSVWISATKEIFARVRLETLAARATGR